MRFLTVTGMGACFLSVATSGSQILIWPDLMSMISIRSVHEKHGSMLPSEMVMSASR